MIEGSLSRIAITSFLYQEFDGCDKFWASNHNTPDAYYPETFDVLYSTDGKLVGKGMKSLNTLKSGSYIINDRKVIIR